MTIEQLKQLSVGTELVSRHFASNKVYFIRIEPESFKAKHGMLNEHIVVVSARRNMKHESHVHPASVYLTEADYQAECKRIQESYK